MTLRISPSLLGSFLYWRDGDFYTSEAEDKALCDLISSIKGEPWEPTEAMLLGRAWHHALEHGTNGSGAVEVTEEGNTFAFDAESVEDVLAEMPAETTAELRGRLDLPEADAVMHLRVDGISGTTIHEHKATSRINVDKYLDSYQWRCYLLAFECRKVIYHLVKLKKDRKSGVYSVGEYLPLPLYAYREMRADVVREVRNFKHFMEDQRLTKYRTERETA